ncbi:hypothetical protein [Candidatus Methylobacter favarea]|uniref:hypothetical protein n=1 Tax=Candidatus Methylobacter favarea TaxID=2707345 RepID=UPI00157D95EC|nr:hypothetical protein [Candidatus Methylobacter favarea]
MNVFTLFLAFFLALSPLSQAHAAVKNGVSWVIPVTGSIKVIDQASGYSPGKI